jgi:hypothetical protein
MGDKNPWSRETAHDELHHCGGHPEMRGPENGRDACPVRNKINDLVPTNICVLLPGFSFLSSTETFIHLALVLSIRYTGHLLKGIPPSLPCCPPPPSTSEHSRRVPRVSYHYTTWWVIGTNYTWHLPGNATLLDSETRWCPKKPSQSICEGLAEIWYVT